MSNLLIKDINTISLSNIHIYEYSNHYKLNYSKNNISLNGLSFSCTSEIIQLPSQKVEKIIELKTNSLVVLIGGQHKGLIGTIKDIKEPSFSRPRMLDIIADNRTLEVKQELVMAIGEKTSEITIQGAE